MNIDDLSVLKRTKQATENVVACYKQFLYRRPEEAKSPERPFSLAVHHQRKPEDRIWFSKRPMRKNKNRPIPFKRHKKPAMVYEREILPPLSEKNLHQNAS